MCCPILFHRIKIKRKFQMENTNRCQAMNSPRGEIKFTHHLNHKRQKTEKYFVYRIFVLPKFTLYIFMNLSLPPPPLPPPYPCVELVPQQKKCGARYGASSRQEREGATVIANTNFLRNIFFGVTEILPDVKS